ncbi:hypothetical protein PMZ80_003653 [Knufia obscura]|uniref:F-box domain-containing protein n=2 Tax=Knufia TaxID=430999 RepID=A0AAN8ELL4_9EURO|nr:hypothetical protein PMZ80_003653 [Knufia obscura]KAK5958434.1 hypothetical protein OHC33_000277 [Knufia fluminis]
MAKFNDIPNEILFQIFSHLAGPNEFDDDPCHITDFELYIPIVGWVCQRWRNVAFEIFLAEFKFVVAKHKMEFLKNRTETEREVAMDFWKKRLWDSGPSGWSCLKDQAAEMRLRAYEKRMAALRKRLR